MKYLRDTAPECNAAFIVLTETHLKPDILNAEVKIEGYSLYRSDRGENKSLPPLVINGQLLAYPPPPSGG